jgi:acyl-CoA thioesterase-1
MKKRIILLSFVLSTCLLLLGFGAHGCGAGAPEAGSQQNARKGEGVIVAMGNSLTAGYGISESEAYPALLEKQLAADGYAYRVVNAGISGETSSGALSRVQWILTLKPDIVILETGANDGFRGIDPALVERNIDETVRILQENGATVVLAGMQIVRNLGREYTDAFNAIYPRVAQKHGVILIPFFLEGVAGEPELNQADTIHPTARGYEIISKTVYPHVVKAIKKREAEKGKNR